MNATKTVFTSKYFRIIQKVIEREGKTFTKDIIQRNPVVMIIAYTPENDVYIESQYRDALGEEILETIAGTIEEGDDPLDTAKRELKEEAGLTAKTWKKIAEWQLNGNMDAPIHLFAATDIEEGEQELDYEEDIKIMKIPLTHVLKKIDDGEIVLAGHIAAFMLFDQMRKEGKL